LFSPLTISVPARTTSDVTRICRRRRRRSVARSARQVGGFRRGEHDTERINIAGRARIPTARAPSSRRARPCRRSPRIRNRVENRV